MLQQVTPTVAAIVAAKQHFAEKERQNQQSDPLADTRMRQQMEHKTQQ